MGRSGFLKHEYFFDRPKLVHFDAEFVEDVGNAKVHGKTSGTKGKVVIKQVKSFLCITAFIKRRERD